MALAPLYIRAIWESAYGDFYLPYLLAPGIHITYPVERFFGGRVFHWLLGHMDSFPASVLCIIIVPGLVGVATGGMQWWVLGVIWDRLAGRSPAEPTSEQPPGR
jgi:hypothetical protein